MKYHTISISLYSINLCPEDYTDGQENNYNLTEEQYKHFLNTKWESVYDLEEYIKDTTTDDDCITEAEEYIDKLCDLDNIIFDYTKQEYYEL